MDIGQLALEILNNDCAKTRDDENGVREHWIELHCVILKVWVKVAHRGADGLPDGYDVVRTEWVAN